MALLDINLLQAQQARVGRINRANFVVAVVSGTIIGLLLLVAVFLYSTLAIRDAQKNGAIKKTADLQQEITKLNAYDNPSYDGMSLTQQAQAFQQQVDALKSIIGSHNYFSLYLDEVAINTPNTVKYTAFNIDNSNRLVISGEAQSYADVSKLADSFTKLSFAKGANIQEAKLNGQGGKVRFVLVIDLKSAAELNLLPKPSSGLRTPQPGASARPTASPAAATGTTSGAATGNVPGAGSAPTSLGGLR